MTHDDVSCVFAAWEDQSTIFSQQLFSEFPLKQAVAADIWCLLDSCRTCFPFLNWQARAACSRLAALDSKMVVSSLVAYLLGPFCAAHIPLDVQNRPLRAHVYALGMLVWSLDPLFLETNFQGVTQQKASLCTLVQKTLVWLFCMSKLSSRPELEYETHAVIQPFLPSQPPFFHTISTPLDYIDLVLTAQACKSLESSSSSSLTEIAPVLSTIPHQFPLTNTKKKTMHALDVHPFVFFQICGSQHWWETWKQDYAHIPRPRSLSTKTKSMHSPSFRRLVFQMCTDNGWLEDILSNISPFQYAIHPLLSENKKPYQTQQPIVSNLPFAFEIVSNLTEKLLPCLEPLPIPIRFLQIHATIPGWKEKHDASQWKPSYAVVHEDLNEFLSWNEIKYDTHRDQIIEILHAFQQQLAHSPLCLQWRDPLFKTYIMANIVEDEICQIVITGWSDQTQYLFHVPRFLLHFPHELGPVLVCMNNATRELGLHDKCLDHVWDAQAKFFSSFLQTNPTQGKASHPLTIRTALACNLDVLHALFRLSCSSQERQCEYAGVLDEATHLPILTTIGTYDSVGVYIPPTRKNQEQEGHKPLQMSFLCPHRICFHTHNGGRASARPSRDDLLACAQRQIKKKEKRELEKSQQGAESTSQGVMQQLETRSTTECASQWTTECLAVTCGVWVYSWRLNRVPVPQRAPLCDLIINLIHAFFAQIPKSRYSMIAESLLWQAKCNAMWTLPREILATLATEFLDTDKIDDALKLFFSHPGVFYLEFLPYPLYL